MKLRYFEWKEVKAFLCCIDKPVSTSFSIHIKTRWFDGVLVYDVEIPQEFIDGSEADSRIE